jgi:hypothetical protein
MSPEKRLCERSDIFLIVEFKPLRYSYEYCIGVTNNCSRGGFSFESYYHDLTLGEVFEFNLKHPYIDLSVPAVGEIIWKKEAWYARVTGVKLRDMDQETHEKISELISSDHDILAFPSIPPEKSDADNDEKRTFEPDLSTVQKDNVILDRFQQDNGITLKYAGELFTGPSVSDNQIQCDSADKTANNSATLDCTWTANVSYPQKSYLNKSPFHSGSPFGAMCKAVIADTLVSLRNSNDRSWLHIPLALLVTGFATIALSMEFDLVRLEASPHTTIATTMLPKSHAALPDYRDDESGITCEQELHNPGKPEISYAMCSEPPGQILAANLHQSPERENAEEDKKYFVQVGAWKNPDYAHIILRQLQREYPGTYIMSKNNFQIMLIPGIESKIQGLNVSKAIQSKFDLNPVLTSNKIYSQLKQNAKDQYSLHTDNNSLSTKKADTQQQSPPSRLNVSKQPRRRIKPKSAYKIDPIMYVETKLKEREVLISQKNSGNREGDFKELPEPVFSTLRNQFMIRTMHRNPDIE